MRQSDEAAGTYDARLLAALTLVDWIAGDLQRMTVDGTAYLTAGLQGNLEESLGMGNYFLGVAAYERNDLGVAETHLARIVRDHPTGDLWNLANSGFVLAVTLVGLGRHEEANRLATDLSARALDARHPGLLRVTRAFEADLALRQGRPAEAIRWADEFELDPAYPVYRWFISNLIYARARIAQETDDARAEAAGLLEELRETYESIHAIRALIEVLAHQALLEDSIGNARAADTKTSEALRLAEPGGFIRLFVDLGRPMRDLLRRVGPGSDRLPYVRRILAAFVEQSLGISGEIDFRASAPEFDSGRLLALEITNRELEVLSLLAERLSNKEIAERMGIGTGTVTTHTASLYRKLDVSSRREAATKAEALGILGSR
jgi:LuxR family maltose regulon positive regulatory protein